MGVLSPKLDFDVVSSNVASKSTEEKGCQEHQSASKAPKSSNAFFPSTISNYSRILSFLPRSPNTTSAISSNSAFLAAALFKSSKISNEAPSSPTLKPSIIPFFARKWPSTSPSLRSVHHPVSCTFTISMSVRNLFTEHLSFSSFIFPFNTQNH